jgi:hypothetical protein
MYFCDPKTDPSMTTFLDEDVASIGGFRVPDVGHLQAFFEANASRIVVINGIDVGTNAHDNGTAHTWSGGFSGLPAFGAVVAAAAEFPPALAYMVSGYGYETTEGLVSASHLDWLSMFGHFVRPQMIPTGERGQSVNGMRWIAEQRQARIAQQRANSPFKMRQADMALIGSAWDDASELMGSSSFEISRNANPNIQRAFTVLQAMALGQCISANLWTGHFDTHHANDEQQRTHMDELVQMLQFIVDGAVEYGLTDRLNILVSSEFGRGPRVSGSGKDHWPITSLVAIGPAFGNARVVGGTDDDFMPLPVDSAGNPSATGRVLSPADVHLELRRVAGIDDSFGVLPTSGPPVRIFETA